MSLEALKQILRRADASAAALFNADEVAAWPRASLETLTALGLLREDARAKVITCPGCDMQCLKEVELFGEGEDTRGLIICDQRDDMEPIEIPREDLRRWSVDVRFLANSLAVLLGGSRQAEERVRGRLWWLGQVSAGEHRGDVFLARGTRQDDAAGLFGKSQALQGSVLPAVLTLSDAPAQQVFGEHVRTIPLSSILSVEGGKFQVEMRAITKEIRRGQRRLSASLAKPAAIPDPVLLIRPRSHQVLLRGGELHLSVLSFKLLLFLARHAVEEGGGWVRREDIYDAIWTPEGEEPTVNLSQVDDTVRELRNALNDAEPGSGTQLIDTQRGIGYRLRLKPPEVVIRPD
jgi:DNA-binding winged helix-turn-helix (wHTH) protein